MSNRLLAGAFAAATMAAGAEKTPPPTEAESGTVRLYVVDRYEYVRRLHPQTLAVIDSIDTGPRPHGIVASPDGRTLYITLEVTNKIIRVDVGTHDITGRVEVGPVPNEPTLSQDGRLLFIPLRGGAHTTVVDAETMTVLESLPTGRQSHNAYTAPDGALVYSTSMGDSVISVIDPVALEIVRKIHVGGVPRPMALTDDGATAYVALSGLTGFITIELATDEIVDRVSIDIPEDTRPPPLGTYTHGLLLTPNQRELWVAAYATNTVYGFLMPSQEPFAAIAVDGGPHWFSLHPDGEPLYVTLESTGKVAAIHRGLREVLTTTDVGEGPTRVLAFRTPEPN